MDFTMKNILSIQQQIHTAEKPYKCSGCGEGFWKKISLCNIQDLTKERLAFHVLNVGNSHCAKIISLPFRMNMGEKHYECHKDRKAFTMKSGLNVHQTKHRTEPWGCSDYGTAFVHLPVLIKHRIYR